MADDRAKKQAEMREVIAAAGGAGTKEGWAALWKNDLAMWDLKGPTAVLGEEFELAVKAGKLALKGTALIPGCGSAYDVKALAAAGMHRVVGIDLTEEAVSRSAVVLEGSVGAEVLCGDFFKDARLDALAGTIEFIFDYTFFCAIPTSLREAWGVRTASLLRAGGRLFTLAFPLASDDIAADPAVPGPPHAVSVAEYRRVLEPHGIRMEGEPRVSEKSVRGNEMVIWWVKDL